MCVDKPSDTKNSINNNKDETVCSNVDFRNIFVKYINLFFMSFLKSFTVLVNIVI